MLLDAPGMPTVAIASPEVLAKLYVPTEIIGTVEDPSTSSGQASESTVISFNYDDNGNVLSKTSTRTTLRQGSGQATGGCRKFTEHTADSPTPQ